MDSEFGPSQMKVFGLASQAGLRLITIVETHRQHTQTLVQSQVMLIAMQIAKDPR